MNMPDPTSKEIVSEEQEVEIQQLFDSFLITTEATPMKVRLVFSAARALLRDRSARIASEASKDAEIARLREAPAKLRDLAEWFAQCKTPGTANDQVEQDLRRWADCIEGLSVQWRPIDPPQESKP